MGIYTGQYERSIDEKSRLQIPAPLRTVIASENEGNPLYVTLGEHPGTLSIYTKKRFEELSDRMETEFDPGPEALQFELQFFSTATEVEQDKSGRILLPDFQRRKAGLETEVIVAGRKHRIDVWDKSRFIEALGLGPGSEGWPEWTKFIRRRPKTRSANGTGGDDR